MSLVPINSTLELGDKLLITMEDINYVATILAYNEDEDCYKASIDALGRIIKVDSNGDVISW